MMMMMMMEDRSGNVNDDSDIDDCDHRYDVVDEDDCNCY